MTDRSIEVGFGSKEIKDLKTAGERNVIIGRTNIARDELTGRYLPESEFSKAKDILDIRGTIKDLTGSTPRQLSQLINSGSNMLKNEFKEIKEMMLNGAKKMQNGSL